MFDQADQKSSWSGLSPTIYRLLPTFNECLLKDEAAVRRKITDWMRQQKKRILHKLCIDMERSEYTSFSMLAGWKCEFQWTSIFIPRYMDSRG